MTVRRAVRKHRLQGKIQPKRFNREDEFVEFVKDYAKENGYAPSYDEIRKSLGLRSKGSVFNLMKRLSEGGKIIYVPGRARTLRVV